MVLVYTAKAVCNPQIKAANEGDKQMSKILTTKRNVAVCFEVECPSPVCGISIKSHGRTAAIAPQAPCILKVSVARAWIR